MKAENVQPIRPFIQPRFILVLVAFSARRFWRWASSPVMTCLALLAVGQVRAQDSVGNFRSASTDAPRFRFSETSFSTQEKAGEVEVAVVRGADPANEASVGYRVEAGTASPGFDYTPVEGRLTFEAGVMRRIIRVPILDDSEKEPTEVFRIYLSDPSPGSALGVPASATIRVADNDPGFAFEETAFNTEEGSPAIRLVVSRGGEGPEEVSVDYATEAGSATPGMDYAPVAGTLIFGPYQSFATIEIPLLDDSEKELTESFSVVLRNPSRGQSLGTIPRTTVRIFDNDRGVAFGSASYTVSESSPTVSVQVSLLGFAQSDFTVDYTTEPVSATGGPDFTPLAGTLRFGPGETAKTIEVPILNDTLKEQKERFRIILSNPSAGVGLIAPWITTVGILDNDPGFHFSASSSDVPEDGAQVDLLVDRGTDAPGDLTVDYYTEPLSALANEDFTAVSGTLHFAATESMKSITVPILNDGLREARESFTLVLTNASPGAFIGAPSSATITIIDNDPGFVLECPPDLPNCGTVDENGGSTRVDIVLRGDFATTDPASVNVVTMSRSAQAGADFEPVSEWVQFAPGETRKSISISIINDELTEGDEMFQVVLLSSVGTPLGNPRGLNLTIRDNERGYTLASTPEFLRVRENANAGIFRIFREGDFQVTSSVDVYTLDRAAGSTAMPGEDFIAISNTVTFLPGETMKTISVPLIDDNQTEFTEFFGLRLAHPTSGLKIQENGAWLWVEIQDNELNPLRVDPDFNPAVAEGGDPIPLADGRIIVPTPLSFLTGEDGTGVVCLLPNGALDPSFQLAKVWNMQVLAPDSLGGLVLGGSEDMVVNGVKFPYVARLLPDGTLDPAFHPQASTVAYSTVSALAPQPDGAILAGTYDPGSILFRLQPDGAVDSTFHTPRISGSIQRIVLDATGRALIGGWVRAVDGEPRPNLARILADGSLDRSFLADWHDEDIESFAIEETGSILVKMGGDSGSRFARLNTSGDIEKIFAFNPGLQPRFFLPLPAGKILLASDSDFDAGAGMLTRLNPDGSADASFPPATYTVYFSTSQEWGGYYNLALETTGDLLVSGTVQAVNGRSASGPIRLQASRSLPRVDLDVASANVYETNASVPLTLIRTGDSSLPMTVHWRTGVDGTARPGVDFEPAGGEVTFAAGEAEHQISLALIDNDQPEPRREVRLTFTGPDGPLPDAALTILNDDLGFLSINPMTQGLLLSVAGRRPGQTIIIQRSVDLLRWEDWRWWESGNESGLLDSEQVFDGPSKRFYRIKPE